MDEWLRLLDDARAEEGARSRARQRDLRSIAQETAELAGALVDLAERGSLVTVRTTAGRAHRGAIRLVATDFCVVGAEGGDVWLALDAVTTVRPDPTEQHAIPTGARAPTDLLLLEALARVAHDCPRVTFVLGGGEIVSGELRAIGVDVATLGLDGDAGGLVYVATSSIRESNVNNIG